MAANTTSARKATGRLWAYIGLILGGLGSIAANIAHSFIKPDDVPADWSPEPGAVISAMIWPVFLFIAIEILARTPWPTGVSWVLLRWIGLPPVALVAAIVSYRHLSGLLDHYGEETLTVWIGPLAVDGLMLMATAALLATGKRHTRPNPVTAPTPATVAPAPSVDTAPATVRPAAELMTPATTTTHPEPANPATAASIPPAPAAPEPTPTPEEPPRPKVEQPASVPAASTTAATGTASTVTAALLPRARRQAEAYEQEHGEPITAGPLAVRLGVPTKTARDVLDVLYPEPTVNTGAHNGTTIGATR
ncbi:DUF2637 domain-containing protein [Phytohabitans kaempferiae]|uniref:DUF2637 domain-containing protein n=1 Tax=Phytohabitans kaempferiae TaxID=1620943 RepID=A0ABV6M131_9ACTN